MSAYCTYCETLIDNPVSKSFSNTFVINSEIITVNEVFEVCPLCHHIIEDVQLEEEVLKKAYYIYRSRHNLMQPEDMRYYRKQYGLSQKITGLLLDIQDYGRFERGALQTKRTDKKLRLLENPLQIYNLFTQKNIKEWYLKNATQMDYTKTLRKIKSAVKSDIPA